VVDADIQGFFDAIDQDLLLEKLENRISDRRVLKLLRQWLRAGVRVETGGRTAAEVCLRAGERACKKIAQNVKFLIHCITFGA
jgi:hypothetical protein